MVPQSGRILAHQLVTNQYAISSLNVRLAKGSTSSPGATATMADFTECDFPGYAHIANPAFAVPTINGSGQAEGQSPLLTWTAASIVTPQTILYIYVTLLPTLGSEALFWFKAISPTVTLANPGEIFQRYVDMFADDIAALD